VTDGSVLVVGGGRWQIPIIEEAHRAGLVVVSTGPVADSPTAAPADFHEIADARDWVSNLDVARSYQVDAVVTDQTDVAVPTVAMVAQLCGLPSIGVGRAMTFTNKFAMRTAVAGVGMAQPEFSLCRTADDVKRHVDRYGLPAVMKPVDGQSSRGVSVSRTQTELAERFSAAQVASPAGLVICETFLAGTEYTVEGIVVNGAHHVLAISEKEHLHHNACVAGTLMFRHANADPVRRRIATYVTRLIEALGLPFGLTHTEVMVDGDQIHLVETAARGGGTLLSSLIAPTLSGVNTGDALLRMALGAPVAIPVLAPIEDAVVLQFFTFPPGRVRAVEGTDALTELPGVLQAGLFFTAGDTLTLPQDDSARHMFVVARGETEVAAAQAAQSAFERVSVAYS
jgi:biotin carboxylase